MCQSLFRPFLLGGPCTPQALAANIRAAGDFLKTGLDIDNLTYPYIESVELAARHTAPEPLRAWDAHMLREVKKHYDASLSQGEQEHECVCVSGEPALYSAPLALPQSGMSRQTQMPYLCLAWLWLGLVLRGGGRLRFVCMVACNRTHNLWLGGSCFSADASKHTEAISTRDMPSAPRGLF